jgi:glutathione synthase/RimK-type ligase-like ATP-grasp enzyme
MNKISVLAKNRETYFIQRLTEEVGEVEFIDPWEGPRTPSEDLLLVRTTSVHGQGEDLEYLRRLPSSIRIVNSLSGLMALRSKKNQYELFGKLGIPQLPWLDLMTTEISVVMAFLENFPVPRYIIKPHRGQGGWGIRALTMNEVLQWFQTEKDKEYVLQPFIHGAIEYRYFFIAQDWSWTLKRGVASGEVAANFQRQGTVRSVDPDPRFHQIVRQLRQEIDLHYGAMDILIIEDELFVLEVNTVPGIEQLEAASGKSVIRLLLNSLS